MDDGGVLELYEETSNVDEDFPEFTSPLLELHSLDLPAWKLARDRRRSSLKNGILQEGWSRKKEFETDSPGRASIAGERSCADDATVA